MIVEIFKNIILNISLLVLIAYLLTKIRVVKEFILDDRGSPRVKIAMSVLFGLIGILSTYTGIEVNGAIANTRVIAVVAGGILGGPAVGLGAGLVAGVHRYLIDIGGFTATACAVSTIAEGIIGGVFSKFIKRTDDEWLAIGGVTMLAEVVQMAIILLIARPLTAAWQLVEIISLPMILFNSIGVVVFVAMFDSVFIEQDREAGRRISMVLDIADKCLPYLRRGMYDRPSLDQATKLILEQAGVSGVVISDRTKVLSYAGAPLKNVFGQEGPLPELVRRVLSTGRVQIAEEAGPEDPLRGTLSQLTAVGAPLTQQDGGVSGALVLFIRKFKLTRDVECGFVGGLAKIFSTQLELSELEYQKKLLQKAEFAALQSQINPHFLFNALSTITSFCREKPDRARELLIVLSNYFRNTLQSSRYMISLQDELEHVNAYLELEKARFEEKLQIEEDVSENLDCTVPSFILQPIVENAVKHGAMCGAGVGMVEIKAKKKRDYVNISVRDNGAGIPPEVVERLYKDQMGENSVGLANVHKRLRSIYGENYGLRVHTGKKGTEVIIRIPQGAAPGGGQP